MEPQRKSTIATLAGAALALFAGGQVASNFVAASGTHAQVSQLRGAQSASIENSAGRGSIGAAAAICSVAAMGAAAAAKSWRRPAKTAAKYTTQTILPAIAWLPSGIKKSDIAPATLRAVTLGGNDILIGKTDANQIFAVGNLCPHIGTPMSEGADVIGDVIVCPLHGSSWKVTTGDLIDWCPSPPIIGPLTGFVVEKKNLLLFECRESGLFGGGEIEVQVDVNAKKAYEADYWKGLLDAQGKDDGTFY